jgi:hypothetical protein
MEFDLCCTLLEGCGNLGCVLLMVQVNNPCRVSEAGGVYYVLDLEIALLLIPLVTESNMIKTNSAELGNSYLP